MLRFLIVIATVLALSGSAAAQVFDGKTNNGKHQVHNGYEYLVYSNGYQYRPAYTCTPWKWKAYDHTASHASHYTNNSRTIVYNLFGKYPVTELGDTLYGAAVPKADPNLALKTSQLLAEQAGELAREGYSGHRTLTSETLQSQEDNADFQDLALMLREVRGLASELRASRTTNYSRTTDSSGQSGGLNAAPQTVFGSLFKDHACLECHNGVKREGNLDLSDESRLSLDVLDNVLDRVAETDAGRVMPPPPKQPVPLEVQRLANKYLRSLRRSQ